MCSWLRKAVYHKARDWLRGSERWRCQCLDEQEHEWIDEEEASRAALAELREWLEEQLERVGPGHEKSYRLLVEHYLHERSFKELAAE